MTETILLLGGNLGDRQKILDSALKKIATEIGEIIAVSPYYESEPWGFMHENLFLNRAIKVKTALSAFQLLEKIQLIEKSLGRVRTGKMEARLIDIDILFFGSEVVKSSQLTLPHPKISERLFALLPLAEITGNSKLPVLRKSALELIKSCKDNSRVQLLHPVKIS